MSPPREHLGITADPTKQGAARREERNEAAERNAMLQWLLSTPQGRALAYYLEDKFLGLGEPIWGGDADHTMLNAGIHDRGLLWQQLLQEASPEQYVLMKGEARHMWSERARRKAEALAEQGDENAQGDGL